MDSFEKLERAIALKSTPEIPVYPHILLWAARCAGMTQAELFSSNKQWLRAMTKTIERVGRPDVVFPMNPRDTSYVESMRVKLPGRELGPEEPFQFVEEEVMQASDYDLILEKGWNAWNTEFMKKIQYKPLHGSVGNLRVLLGFIRAGMHTGTNIKYWKERGLPVMFHTGLAPAFDVFSLSRSLRPFYRDIYDIPERVKKAVDVGTEAMIALGKANARRAKGNRIAIFAMRSSASFISPKIWEEFSFPYLKRMIDSYHADGFVSVVHCDGNWDRMLPYFKEFPRASCIVELDGATDIRKAREVLAEHLCIKGNVRAALLSLGAKEEVETYCRELIDFMGHDGGFILGSGCEVPLTAKLENVAALIGAVRR
jgi:uroporphyrinogen decarboxylase